MFIKYYYIFGILILIVIFLFINNILRSSESFKNKNKKKSLYQTYFDKSLIPQKVFINNNKYAPNYDIIIYDDKECLHFINKFYGSEVLDAYKQLKIPAHRADLWRYCILYQYGGLYMDIKTKLIKNVDGIFTNKNILYTVISCVKSDKPDKQSIFNGIIYSPPKNPIFLELINYCVKNKNVEGNYLIFTKHFARVIKKHSLYNTRNLTNNLIKMKNMPDIYLFKEKCIKRNPLHEYKNKNLFDRYGILSYIYDKGEKVIKTRYSDYPWKNHHS